MTFTNKINGDGKEADGKVEVKPGEKPKPDIVKKSVVTDSENRKATWTITVTPPEGKTVKNLVIKDELQDFYNWKGKYEGTVTIKEAGSTLTEGTDYTVAKTAGGNGVNPTMTLVFSKEISGVLEITYASDYTDSGSYSGWVGIRFILPIRLIMRTMRKMTVLPEKLKIQTLCLISRVHFRAVLQNGKSL